METGTQRNDYDDEIDLSAVFRVLWAAWYWILLAGAIAGGVALAVVLNLPNVYKSEAVLSPVSDSKSGNLAGIAGQLGGLASLAGISLGGGSGVDKATTSIEILKSRVFLINFIHRHQMAVPLMAAQGWDPEKQEWIIDPEIYDLKQKKWTREIAPPLKAEPSDMELYEKFQKSLYVGQDKKTQIVNLSVESFSPLYAKKWAQLLVDDVNQYIKAKDVDEAERSINYLTNEIKNTSITEIQSVFYQMIEEQKKTVMLAAVRADYAFQVIDPPIVPEKKIRPKRALIVLMVGAMAAFIACFVVLVTRSATANAQRRE